MTDLPYAAAEGGSAAGHGWTPKLVLSTLFMALVLEALGLGATMISIGLPSILKTFPTTQVGWLTTAYFLTGAVCAPLAGKAADLFGKRRVLLTIMLVSGDRRRAVRGGPDLRRHGGRTGAAGPDPGDPVPDPLPHQGCLPAPDGDVRLQHRHRRDGPVRGGHAAAGRLAHRRRRLPRNVLVRRGLHVRLVPGDQAEHRGVAAAAQDAGGHPGCHPARPWRRRGAAVRQHGQQLGLDFGERAGPAHRGPGDPGAGAAARAPCGRSDRQPLALPPQAAAACRVGCRGRLRRPDHRCPDPAAVRDDAAGGRAGLRARVLHLRLRLHRDSPGGRHGAVRPGARHPDHPGGTRSCS